MAPATQTLLDVSRTADALACGYEAREIDGLKVRFEADPQVGCCVYISKAGVEIDLYGDAEINEVIRALKSALSRNAARSAVAIAAE